MKQPYQITRVSPFSGRSNTLELTFDMEDYRRWDAGMLIQNAMPYLTPSEREFLMTGITDEEWNATFGEPTTKLSEPADKGEDK